MDVFAPLGFSSILKALILFKIDLLGIQQMQPRTGTGHLSATGLHLRQKGL